MADDSWKTVLNEIKTIGIETHNKKAVLAFGCYAFRNRIERDGKQLVAPESLDTDRVHLLQNLLDEIASDLRTGRMKKITVWTSVLRHLKPVFHWLDNVATNNDLGNTESINKRYEEYTKYLIHHRQDFEDTTRYLLQKSARRFFFLAAHGPSHSLGQGVPRITPKSNAVLPPNENAVTENLAIAYQLFTQLSDFVLNTLPYPFGLNLPNETVKVLPCTIWALPRQRLARRTELTNGNWIWDYESGTINSVEFVQQHYGYSKRVANREIKKAESQLELANSATRSIHRLRMASLAKEAFQVLMLSATGANPSPFRKFPWTTDIISTPSERQGFRIYKDRASKEVYFELQSSFIPLFNKYLKLRQYLLNGKHCETLFFREHKSVIRKIHPLFLYTYHIKVTSMLAPDLQAITPTEYRKYKCNWVLDRHGPIIASTVMQNTPSVITMNYGGANKKKQQTEITSFFSYMANISKEQLSRITTTASGGCLSQGSPKENGSYQGIEKDCTNYWGCTFCGNYVLHADEEDLFKLHSISTVIGLAKESSIDFSTELEQTAQRVSDNIAMILEKRPDLLSSNHELIEKVSNGYLHPFWQAQVDLWAIIGKIK